MSFPLPSEEVEHHGGARWWRMEEGGYWDGGVGLWEAAAASRQQQPFSFICFPSRHPSHRLLPPSAQLAVNHPFLSSLVLSRLQLQL